ncbi:MAG: hypothetical protein R3F54_15255 [Alphaproteobacteria bacterium]
MVSRDSITPEKFTVLEARLLQKVEIMWAVGGQTGSYDEICVGLA